MYKVEEFRERGRDEYVLIPPNASHVLCARIIAFFDGNDDAQ
jgi:hypothetical protein